MSRRLGMAPDQVRSSAEAIHSQVTSLDIVQGQILAATALTANPFDLLPGDLVLAPWSIGQATAASSDILLAQASAHDLIQKLFREAEAQEYASSWSDDSYRTPWAPRTPDTTPPTFDDFPSPWELLMELWDGLQKVYSWGEAAIAVIAAWMPTAEKALKTWLERQPPWVKTTLKIGKLIPILGTGLDIVDLVFAYRDGDVAGVVRSFGAIAIDALAVIALMSGAGAPVAAILALAGVLWDLSWDAGENMIEMMNNPIAAAQFFTENPWVAIPLVISPLITFAFMDVVE